MVHVCMQARAPAGICGLARVACFGAGGGDFAQGMFEILVATAIVMAAVRLHHQAVKAPHALGAFGAAALGRGGGGRSGEGPQGLSAKQACARIYPTLSFAALAAAADLGIDCMWALHVI